MDSPRFLKRHSFPHLASQIASPDRIPGASLFANLVQTPGEISPNTWLTSSQKIRPLARLARIREAEERLGQSMRPRPYRDLSQRLTKEERPPTPLQLQLSDLRKKVYRTERKLEQESQEKRRLEQLSQEYYQQIERLQRLNKTLEQQIAAVSRQIPGARLSSQQTIPSVPKQSSRQEVENLRQQTIRLEQELNQLKSEARQKQAGLNNLIQKNRAVLNQGRDLQTNYQTVLALRNNLQQALENAQAELAEKKARGQEEDELAALRGQINRLETKVKAQEKKIAELAPLKEKYSAQLKERERLEKYLADVEGQIKNKQNAQEQLQSALAQKEAQLQQVQKRVVNYQHQQQTQQQQLDKQKESLDQLLKDKKHLSAFIKELTAKLQTARSQLALQSPATQEFIQKQVETKPPKPIPVKKVKVPKKKLAALQPLTNLPNTISGVVKDPAGHLLKGAVLIIKDLQGNPLRAVRTNELGQFSLTTALPNNPYLIEVSYPNQKFDILEIKLDGEVLPPIEIQGKALP